MTTQLWSDERITGAIRSHPNRSWELTPRAAAHEIARRIRDDYEAKIASLETELGMVRGIATFGADQLERSHQRIADLTAEVERLRAAETWEPLEDGAYNVPDGVVEISRGTVQLWHEKSRKYQRAITLKHGWAIFKRKAAPDE